MRTNLGARTIIQKVSDQDVLPGRAVLDDVLAAIEKNGGQRGFFNAIVESQWPGDETAEIHYAQALFAGDWQRHLGFYGYVAGKAPTAVVLAKLKEAVKV